MTAPPARGQYRDLLLAGSKQGVKLLLERVVTDAVVQLGTGLHGVDHVLLMAFGTNGVVHILGCVWPSWDAESHLKRGRGGNQ